MTSPLQSLSLWDSLRAKEQRQEAERLAEKLPDGWRFGGIVSHSLSGQEHRVAYFSWHRTRFALVPGGRATLGYDGQHPFRPTQVQLADWERTRQAYGEDLDAFLDKHLTPLRQVSLKPFLLQVQAMPLDPVTDATVWGKRKGGTSPMFFFPQDVAMQVNREGFRLPTSDEWEYACAAGTRTLFRWGDECPLDADPIDVTGWDLHRRPNAFGLQMPSNPYKWEFCAEPTVIRGGDGGGRISSGEGQLEGWLPLASSFHVRIPRFKRSDVGIPGVYLRRALSVPDT